MAYHSKLRMTVTRNIECLSLASDMNGGNIRLRMMLNFNVRCLSLASFINDVNYC